MFVRKKTYTGVLNELSKCALEKDSVKQKLAEAIALIQSHSEKEITVEALTKKEEQLKESIMKNEKLNDELIERIEIEEEKLDSLERNAESKGEMLNDCQLKLSSLEKELSVYNLALDETKSKCKNAQAIQLGLLMKIRSYQLELQRINKVVLKQSNEIHEIINKGEIKLANRLNKEINNKKARLLQLEKKIKEANNVFGQKASVLKEVSELKSKLIFMREELQLQEVGFYKNIFSFTTIEQYKEELKLNNDKQKTMIRNKEVVHEGTSWTVNGSKRAGRVLTNNNIRLMIRSFNNDCDNSIQSLKYTNVTAINKRIEKSFEMINKFNEQNSLSIKEEYLQLKLEEMKLVYERLKFEQEEKEALSILRAEERERKQVEKEISAKYKELADREKELEKELKALKQDYKLENGEKHDIIMKIQEVESNLTLVHKKREEVDQRKKVGKSGYVYIISNIGVFGEGIYKIGMTRRLEPLDRITELSGASVPFRYDVHAMILTDDAPKLENHLHHIFRDHRVNLVNNRKEFFNVSIEKIKREVFSIIGQFVIFEDIPKAKEYYETITIRNAIEIANKKSDLLYC